MTTTDKKDLVYEIITERIVEMLKQGTVPWRKTWNAGNAPRNIDGYRYRGINVFLLHSLGYSSPFWMTFKQAQKRGGSVRKGEHGTVIVFWKIFRKAETDEVTGEREVKTIPMLRYYRVFNLEQTENVKLPKAVAEFNAQAEREVETRVEAEDILAGYENGPLVRETGDQPVYMPLVDRVEVPPRNTFESADEFYVALFHELGHSTGHPSRLNRFQSGAFGSHEYGREELVAEMTAAFLAGEAGIETTMPSHAAYLDAWIHTISEDVRAVVVAAGAAQRAADLILGHTAPHEQSNDDSSAAA